MLCDARGRARGAGAPAACAAPTAAVDPARHLGPTSGSTLAEAPPRGSLLLDGAPLPAAPPSLTVALHKPRGVVTTCADEELAPSGKTYPGVRTLLSAPHRALAPIGRLDADSEGLLLLTNDGALSAAVCQSASCVKRYLVRIAPRRGCYAPSGAFEEVAETQLQVGVDIGLARPGRCERARRVTAEEAAGGGGLVR